MKSPGGGCPAERGGGETCTLHHGGGGGGAGLHPQPPLSGGDQTRVIRARPASPPCSCGSTHSSTAHVAEEGREAQGSPARRPRACRDPEAARPGCPGRTPDGLAAALGLRTVAGLARFILSPVPRRRRRRRAVTEGKAGAGSAVPPPAHSFIRPGAVSAAARDLRRKGPRRPAPPSHSRGPREPRLRSAGQGSLSPPAAAHAPQSYTPSAEPRPRPSRNRKSPPPPSAPQLPEEQEAKQRGRGSEARGSATSERCLQRPLAAGGRRGAAARIHLAPALGRGGCHHLVTRPRTRDRGRGGTRILVQMCCVFRVLLSH